MLSFKGSFVLPYLARTKEQKSFYLQHLSRLSFQLSVLTKMTQRTVLNRSEACRDKSLAFIYLFLLFHLFIGWYLRSEISEQLRDWMNSQAILHWHFTLCGSWSSENESHRFFGDALTFHSQKRFSVHRIIIKVLSCLSKRQPVGLNWRQHKSAKQQHFLPRPLEDSF